MSDAPAARIVRILNVVDTRQYEEQGDRWIPIPGSGNALECSRCGREHEVHAEVELEGGRTAVVGTGCAEKSTMDPAVKAAASSGDRAAKRLAALRAEISGVEKKLAAWDAAWAQVAALPLPAVEIDADVELPGLKMGDAWVGTRFGGITEERRTTLVSHWRDLRMKERGFSPYRSIMANQRDAAVEAVERLLKRHPELATVARAEAA